ncbi:MAG TPA: hypothetical protein VJ969_02960 [Desulfopila sp.]|nr:hypothetical protein [Desulfopila sp.]
MSRPLRIQYPGAFYYITQHGNLSLKIFGGDEDRCVFVDVLTRSLTTYGVILHGFILLTNHFHLLLETPRSNLSEFMRRLGITYAGHYNRRHRHRGNVFGGRYKSIVIDADRYLGPVSCYLHLNPLRLRSLQRRRLADRLDYLASCKWSSHNGFSGHYPRYHFVTHHRVLAEYGGDTPQGRQNYKEALAKQLRTGFNLKGMISGQNLLGNHSFIEEVKRQHLASSDGDNRYGGGSQHAYSLDQEIILEELQRCLRCDRHTLLDHPGENRFVAMDMLYRYGGFTNAQIGGLMALDYTSISYGRRTITARRLDDQDLNARMIFAEKRLARLQRP